MADTPLLVIKFHTINIRTITNIVSHLILHTMKDTTPPTKIFNLNLIMRKDQTSPNPKFCRTISSYSLETAMSPKKKKKIGKLFRTRGDTKEIQPSKNQF